MNRYVAKYGEFTKWRSSFWFLVQPPQKGATLKISTVVQCSMVVHLAKDQEPDALVVPCAGWQRLTFAPRPLPVGPCLGICFSSGEGKADQFGGVLVECTPAYVQDGFTGYAHLKWLNLPSTG